MAWESILKLPGSYDKDMGHPNVVGWPSRYITGAISSHLWARPRGKMAPKCNAPISIMGIRAYSARRTNAPVRGLDSSRRILRLLVISIESVLE